MSPELRRDVARYRGATHTMCFTDEVMQHKFPEGFKPINIEAYDGTSDRAVWIEDFLLLLSWLAVMISTPLNTSP